MATYHAFHCGKMNQSFRLENEGNQVFFEANLVKFKLFTACPYDFVDKRTGKTETHKIGKTVTNDSGVLGINMTVSSYFKYDGVNCFKILDEKGYKIGFLPKINIFQPQFALKDKADNQIAVFKMNVPGEKEEGVMGIGKQSNIEITTESEDLELIFFVAFILGRVDFSGNTL